MGTLDLVCNSNKDILSVNSIVFAVDFMIVNQLISTMVVFNFTAIGPSSEMFSQAFRSNRRTL